MTLYPNCKINIGLRVVCKREDGYHDIETIFYPVKGLHDTLSVERIEASSERSECQLTVEGIQIDCATEDNLLVKCYRHMRQHYPQIGAVQIHLKKHIPFGAGLGGGSSDAAHLAIALNELFDLRLSREQLADEVSPLGADCPFFIYNTPCRAEGIGDILTPIDLSLQGLQIVMLKPDVAISTREAYEGIVTHGKTSAVNCGALNVDSIKDLTNDFEQSVFAKYPLLALIKQGMQDAGAIYAAMSGSGSTIFGLFKRDTEGCADAYLRGLDKEFAAMVILNDTLA